MSNPPDNQERMDLSAWDNAFQLNGGQKTDSAEIPDEPSADQELEAHDTSPFPGGGLPQTHAADEPYIEIAQRCDVGHVRSRNEDSVFSFFALAGGENPLIPFSLCLVADGMGGHHDGHEFSRRVAQQVARQVLEKVYLPLMDGRTMQMPLQEIMAAAVHRANESVSTVDPDKEGGTTLTAVLIVGRRLYLVHVGDSRAYLLHEGTLQQLTTDHTIVKRLEDAGHISPEEAAVHPQRNLLYRAVTGDELDIDTYTRSLPSSGLLFLCSDGLWGSLPDDDICQIMGDQSLPLQDRVEKMVEGALENGSTDNVTGLLINFRLP